MVPFFSRSLSPFTLNAHLFFGHFFSTPKFTQRVAWEFIGRSKSVGNNGKRPMPMAPYVRDSSSTSNPAPVPAIINAQWPVWSATSTWAGNVHLNCNISLEVPSLSLSLSLSLFLVMKAKFRLCPVQNGRHLSSSSSLLFLSLSFSHTSLGHEERAFVNLDILC